jgi:radical S-adenosyl methionine domain-containing protein 2
MKNQTTIPSVNFHLWEPCNMRCKFCFATFQDVKQSILPKGHLPKEQGIEVVKKLAQFGFEKITFAGGEPTLCPWLEVLIQTAKECGMTTMIVTNGSKLDKGKLESLKVHLDWVALSIDSLSSETNIKIGRAITGKRAIDLQSYKELIQRVKSAGFGLKINTVVNKFNYQEDMTELIEFAAPKRWKVLQILPVAGQNDAKVEGLIVSPTEFQDFIDRHKELALVTKLIPESNEAIRGSYAMVDPAGRFFDSSDGGHSYSKPILEVGAGIAYSEVSIDALKFKDRGGEYNWK